MISLRFYFTLAQKLGFFPFRISLYRMAFLPRSAARQHNGGERINNERLEYLGDAVLDTIVADYLFRHYPRGDEGFMSQVRARIVKRKTLDQLAIQVGIPSLMPDHLIASSKAKHLYGNTLEALIGAIYLDRGYPKARQFFIRRILQKHEDLNKLIQKDPDYKSRLIEWAQKNRMEVRFQTIEELQAGKKSPAFVATLYLNDEQKGSGRGSSKKEAEQRASKEALYSNLTA
ncbi:MAG: ribonuclease III [Bacteroidales bacterium]